ncbi:MAG: UDP-N-acetylglucosamine 1-carboxyvinyltransferase [Deltaproteobacteria bacterium]|nr:UDP-N-acetylglucosamine 1-carboxyvinyltransferase [Deltaproteobacteria bacterium]MBW2413874.1 UDP-N-acetylglucosamine 1-carboxyvinyltransferase [Deltaproteobacteria bacterium]
MSQSFEIEGGHAVSGTIRPGGNKNAALPLIAASLLTDDEVVLRNVPAIRDVEALLGLVESLGVRVQRPEPGVVALRADGVGSAEPDPEICGRIRASVLLAGPLLARRGHVRLPPPGGDVIGRRRIDTHVLALHALGATVSSDPREYAFRAAGRLQGAEVFLDEASVTATENAIMAAALAQGTTTIQNAACEPHVQDLCALIQAMGGSVEGAGTNRLRIEGLERLGGAEFTLGPDYTEVGSLITLAAVTGGELRILGARPQEHRATHIGFGRLGIAFHADGDDIVVPGDQDLRVTADLGGAIPKIEDAPWPGFPADLTSLAVVAATQSEGTVLIFEKMFESRLFFVDRLVAMGARLILCDPHRVVVAGRSRLVAQELSSPDIRAGMALVIAALCAEGQSVIHNIGQIDRGYERLDERLSALGARIQRVED